MTGSNFDWRGFITSEFPSNHENASDIQRRRYNLYHDFVLPATDAWCRKHGFLMFWQDDRTRPYEWYLQANAYAQTARTLDPQHRDHALSLTKYTLWLSCVDVMLDEQLLPRLVKSELSHQECLAHLDTILWHLSAPLQRNGYLSDQAIQQCLGIGQDEDRTGLVDNREHLDCLDAALIALFQDLDPKTCELAAQQTVAALGAQRYELATAMNFHHTGALPDLRTYLRHAWGYPQTLLGFSCALLPEILENDKWATWLPPSQALGRATRLFNDRGTFEREFADGKINSITIILSNLSCLVSMSSPPESKQLKRALTIHQSYLDKELNDFVYALRGVQPEGRAPTQQSHLLLATAAFFPAVYEKGDMDISAIPLIQHEGLSSSSATRRA